MYFEEFEPGRELSTPARTITESDLDVFIDWSGLDNPIFRSAEGAAAAGHARRIVPAPMQLSLAMGLCQRAGLFDHVVAVLQFDRVQFKRTVHPGATVLVRARVAGKRPTSNPGRGLVLLDYELVDEDGGPVMIASATYLMRRRPEGEPT